MSAALGTGDAEFPAASVHPLVARGVLLGPSASVVCPASRLQPVRACEKCAHWNCECSAPVAAMLAVLISRPGSLFGLAADLGLGAGGS